MSGRGARSGTRGGRGGRTGNGGGGGGGTAGTGDSTVTSMTPKTSRTVSLSIKELQRLLQEVTSDEITNLVNSVISLKTSDISVSLYSIFEFQGFNPEMIQCKLIVLCRYHKYKDTQTAEEDQVLDAKDFLSMRDDIMYMVAANIYMGNLSGKALGRRSQEGRDKITELSEKYMIEYGSTQSSLNADTITFPRISATFPDLAVKMASKLPSKDFPTGDFHSSDIPKFMRITAFASMASPLLPDRTRNLLKLAVACYSSDQTMVFERGKKRSPTPVSAFGMQWTYIEAASNSPVPSEDVKRDILLEFSVADQYSTIFPIVTGLQTLINNNLELPTKEQFESDLGTFIKGKGL